MEKFPGQIPLEEVQEIIKKAKIEGKLYSDDHFSTLDQETTLPTFTTIVKQNEYHPKSDEDKKLDPVEHFEISPIKQDKIETHEILYSTILPEELAEMGNQKGKEVSLLIEKSFETLKNYVKEKAQLGTDTAAVYEVFVSNLRKVNNLCDEAEKLREEITVLGNKYQAMKSFLLGESNQELFDTDTLIKKTKDYKLGNIFSTSLLRLNLVSKEKKAQLLKNIARKEVSSVFNQIKEAKSKRNNLLDEAQKLMKENEKVDKVEKIGDTLSFINNRIDALISPDENDRRLVEN